MRHAVRFALPLRPDDGDDVEPDIAIFATLAAAVVLARSVDMDDPAIRASFEQILTEEFPEALMKDPRH